MKETKLQVTYQNELLPAVYITDHLYLGESGACIIYMVGSSLYGMFIRYATADAPLSSDTIIKLGAATNVLVQSALGPTAQPVIVVSGTTTYEAFASQELKLTSISLKIGAIIFAKADYIGTYPPGKKDTPTQLYLCFDTGMATPDVISTINNVVSVNLTKAITAKFYAS